MTQKSVAKPRFQRRIRSLDSLRGVAIITVVVYHATPGSLLPGILSIFRSCLWTGVDLFFVLSGFLITRILLGTRDGPRYFRTFYARRFLRIFPLYYLFLMAAVFAVPVAAWLIPSLSHLAESDSFQRLWGGQAWLWLYLHNFVQAAGPSQLPGMGHLWSLAVEEQFYLVWPLLIWLVPRDRLGLCIGMLLVVGAVLRFVVSCWGYSPWSIMHVTFFRLDGLLVGSAVALFECDPRTNEVFRRWRIATFWCATLTVLSVILWRGTFEWIEPDVQRFGFLSFSVMSGCVVHWLSERDRKLGEDRTQRLGSRILQAWGMYSYAIYVLHMPVIHAMKKVCSPLPDGIAVVSVVVSSASVSFLLAYLTWHFFEKHWLKLKPAY